jgi:hypothetical protein
VEYADGSPRLESILKGAASAAEAGKSVANGVKSGTGGNNTGSSTGVSLSAFQSRTKARLAKFTDACGPMRGALVLDTILQLLFRAIGIHDVAIGIHDVAGVEAQP